MAFYQQYIDCSKEQSDWYSNTPAVNVLRNEIPRFLLFGWDSATSPNTARIEFFNYFGMRPSQEYRTTTTRGSLGTISKNSAVLPLAEVVAVPCTAVAFRVRFDERSPTVSKMYQINNNAKFFIEGRTSSVYELYLQG